MVSVLNKIASIKCERNVLRLAPIFEDGNYLNRPPREADGFDRSSHMAMVGQRTFELLKIPLQRQHPTSIKRVF